MRILRIAGGLAVGALGVAGSASAQTATIGFDAAFNSAYVWRGLTYTNKPVLQPDVWLSAYGFTGGVWANIEPGSYTSDISENGSDGAGIAEIDGWVEYARSAGNANWKLGWTIYTFDTNNSGFTAFYDTHEFYGQVSIGGLPITPTLYAAYDVDKVKGAYIQPSVSYGWKAGPNLTINLGALAGIVAGQEVGTDPSANFAKSGLSHVDLSAATSFAAGPLSIAPAFHVQFNHDQFTKVVSPTKPDEGVKFWGGITLSWSHGLGAASE